MTFKEYNAKAKIKNFDYRLMASLRNFDSERKALPPYIHRSLTTLRLWFNDIGQDGLNELLKLMELPSNYLRDVEMVGNPGYCEVFAKRYTEVCVLDLFYRIGIATSRNSISLV